MNPLFNPPLPPSADGEAGEDVVRALRERRPPAGSAGLGQSAVGGHVWSQAAHKRARGAGVTAAEKRSPAARFKVRLGSGGARGGCVTLRDATFPAAENVLCLVSFFVLIVFVHHAPNPWGAALPQVHTCPLAPPSTTTTSRSCDPSVCL